MRIKKDMKNKTKQGRNEKEGRSDKLIVRSRDSLSFIAETEYLLSLEPELIEREWKGSTNSVEKAFMLQRHHKIPLSEGGIDNDSNIEILQASEHYKHHNRHGIISYLVYKEDMNKVWRENVSGYMIKRDIINAMPPYKEWENREGISELKRQESWKEREEMIACGEGCVRRYVKNFVYTELVL